MARREFNVPNRRGGEIWVLPETCRNEPQKIWGGTMEILKIRLVNLEARLSHLSITLNSVP